MLIYLSAVICLVGLAIYCLTEKPKPSTIALHMFWVGLLAFLLTYVPRGSKADTPPERMLPVSSPAHPWPFALGIR